MAPKYCCQSCSAAAAALVSTLLLLVCTDVRSDPLVPCYFIFGDSLVDNGNNNGISTLARADYAPYGIDFPGGPTGRFSNGLTFVDVISDMLGFDNYIPPYASARGNDLLGGVNLASAAAGIRDETGRQLGGRISFAGQVRNYQSAVQQIIDILGDEDAAADHLSKCIFTIGMGSNDYLNNYFMPTYYDTGRRYTPDQWADILIQQYSQQLRDLGKGPNYLGLSYIALPLHYMQELFRRLDPVINLQILYNYGARKVALIGVGQIGCSPNELAQFSPNGVTCVDRINNGLQLFNRRLMSLVDQFNQLAGARFTYINIFGMNQDLLRNPGAYGLRVTNAGCCGVGRNNGQITCLPYQIPCLNRRDHLFWDAFHPTEAANIIIGRRSFNAQSPYDAHPMDISRLARA